MNVDYAKAGEIHCGVDGSFVNVIDKDGNKISHVIEANAKEGWLIRDKLVDGKPIIENDEIVRERVEMKFTLQVSDR